MEELGGIANHCINKTSQNEKGIEKYIDLFIFQLNHVTIYTTVSKPSIGGKINTRVN